MPSLVQRTKDSICEKGRTILTRFFPRLLCFAIRLLLDFEHFSKRKELLEVSVSETIDARVAVNGRGPRPKGVGGIARSA